MIGRIAAAAVLLCSAAQPGLAQDAAALPLEQQIAQMLVAGLPEDGLTPEVQTLIQEEGIGGFLLEWGRNYTTAEELRALTAALQEAAAHSPSRAPLWLGTVVSDGLAQGVPPLLGGTRIPCALTLGASGRAEDAAQAYGAVAAEWRACGLNLVIAPLLELQRGGDGGLQRQSSFGGHPETLTLLGRTAYDTFSAAGLLPVIGPFPGIRDCTGSNRDPMRFSRSEGDFSQIPARQFLAQAPAAILLGHNVIERWDFNWPVALSANAVQGELRTGAGFEGLIVTAPLDAPELSSRYSLETAYLLAAAAGVDVMCQTSPDLSRLRQHVREIAAGVHGKQVSREGIAASYARILRAKQQVQHAPAPRQASRRSPEEALATAANGVVLVRDNALLLPLNPEQQRIVVVCPPSFFRRPGDPGRILPIGPTLGYHVRQLHPETVEVLVERVPDQAQRERALDAAADADLLILGIWGAASEEEQADLFQALLGLHKPSILVALGAPGELSLFPEASTALAAHTPVAAEAVAQILFGKRRPGGSLPLPIGNEYSVGHALKGL